LRSPATADVATLLRVHDREYVEAVRTGHPAALARSQGLRWDPGLWHSACAHVGGLIAAAHTAGQQGCAGSLSSGQHHASRESGAGFCTFNGIALAAIDIVARGAARVLIVDTDAHCAGGTHSLIENESAIWQLDLAVNGYDEYEPGVRATLDIVTDAADYLPTLQSRLEALTARGLKFDLCLYYAGMDPHQGCDTGGLEGIDIAILEARERFVFGWCGAQALPVAFGIGGGYEGPRLSRETLVTLHRLTLEAAVDSAATRARDEGEQGGAT